MNHKLLDNETQKEVLLDPRSLPLPTIGLHHMEGRFLHLLTLLKIKFPLDHHLDPQKVTQRNRRPLQSSSGPEMKRIHLDPSLYIFYLLFIKTSSKIQKLSKYNKYNKRYILPLFLNTCYTFFNFLEFFLQPMQNT